MSIKIWNPTNEEMTMQFEGRTFIMKPGAFEKVTEPCGKHLLTGYGPRGLTSLEHGDNEDAIRDAALARNREFKLKQVIDYNRRNESRKQMNLPFLMPPEFIKTYSRELGIDLLAPFTVREEENARIQQLTDQNKKLAEALQNEKENSQATMQLMKDLADRLSRLEGHSDAKVPKEAKGGRTT